MINKIASKIRATLDTVVPRGVLVVRKAIRATLDNVVPRELSVVKRWHCSVTVVDNDHP
jgi:hypothetical protein